MRIEHYRAGRPLPRVHQAGAARCRVALLALGVLGLFTLSPGARAQGPLIVETHRIRVTNQPGGAVEVSLDGGRGWETIGHLKRTASISAVGSRALEATLPGTVSGTAPEQITVRVPTTLPTPRWVRIAADGEQPNTAAFQTDIPAGESLFRALAPAPGSRVFLERDTGQESLPTNYLPKRGDKLVIVCERSPESPAAVILENKLGGQVALVTPFGEEKIIGRVAQPLRGLGRYAGTEKAGEGAVVAYHGAAIIISTSGRRLKLDADNKPVDDRGGFVIQPAECELKGATRPEAQILVEGLAAAAGGAKPALSPLFGLPVSLSSCVPADAAPTRVDIRIDNGEWEPLPDLRGGVDAADLKARLAAARGDRPVQEGITHLRITPGTAPLAAFQQFTRLAAAPRAASGVQRGRVTITANAAGSGIAFVSFFLDGSLARVTNQAPYVWDWDTTRAANGPHLVEIRGADERGTIVNSVVRKVVVDN
jgi:hypothetical protein